MKTLLFPNVKPLEPSKYEIIKKAIGKTSKNSLYNLLYYGYSNHIVITIRPDDILNNVASIWSKYVVINAEKFRKLFVEHEGKKTLTYYSSGSYNDNRMPEFMAGIKNLILNDQKDDKLTWACQPRFTTSTDEDLFVRTAAILASQKEYYKYDVCLLCGFPEIRLEGTEEDWSDLVLSIQKMPELDDNIKTWKLKLVDIINNMILGTEEFWQSCVNNHRYGSGGQSEKDGWILAFNPINEKGEWISKLKDHMILDLTNEFTLNVNDNGNEFTLISKSGPIDNKLKDGVLSVSNKISFMKKIKANATLIK